MYNDIVDKLLDMKPDPIPKFVLLKEFKGYDQNSMEVQNLYDQICNHPFIKKIEESQNEHGFWTPFHGYTEEIIRKCLSYGLDKNHPAIKKVSIFMTKLLDGKESTGQFEKQDDPRWYPIMFEPLICASMLSLIDKKDKAARKYRQQWVKFAEAAFSKGFYDKNADSFEKKNFFGFSMKRVIPPFNYYNLLLLAPDKEEHFLSERADKALIAHCINEEQSIGYVYNNKPSDFVQINEQNRDSRDFWHWIRALSLLSQFDGWSAYEEKYSKWILSQRNKEGLWEFPKKFDFALSNSWRGKNKEIDSTIFVLRLLMKKKAF